jgi:hypothetical protein
LLNDLMAGPAFDIGNEPDSAGVVIERGIVETRNARFTSYHHVNLAV